MNPFKDSPNKVLRNRRPHRGSHYSLLGLRLVASLFGSSVVVVTLILAAKIATASAATSTTAVAASASAATEITLGLLASLSHKAVGVLLGSTVVASSATTTTAASAAPVATLAALTHTFLSLLSFLNLFSVLLLFDGGGLSFFLSGLGFSGGFSLLNLLLDGLRLGLFLNLLLSGFGLLNNFLLLLLSQLLVCNSLVSLGGLLFRETSRHECIQISVVHSGGNFGGVVLGKAAESRHECLDGASVLERGYTSSKGRRDR